MIDYTVGNPDGGEVGKDVYAHFNRQGSVIATSNASGNVEDKYTYSPYGVSGTTNSGFPFRFTGQRLDAETGLYYYKARYYDSEIGRFLQTDPIGYEDQQNLYAYVGNDPVNATDPTGEITGKILRFGAKIFKHKGNLKKAGKEILEEIDTAIDVLSDGKINADDAAAIFDLASPVTTKEAKKGADAVKKFGKRSRREKNAGKNAEQKNPTQRGGNRKDGNDGEDNKAREKERGERKSRKTKDDPRFTEKPEELDP